ncbi:MAG TPA: FAD-dependent oxidoreductase [Planctomycetota bacterium]|nr:FAD-dependent oxidoreductase [Planctomycetota bacterium]
MRTTTSPSFLLFFAAALSAADHHVDVCVYGGTGAGVIAAVAAANEGRSVLLIEPSRNLGGMTGGGISTIDYGTRRTIGGLTDAFFTKHHPPGSKPDQAGMEAALWELTRHHHITVIAEHRLAHVAKKSTRITGVTVEYAPPERYGTPVAQAVSGPGQTITARVFIDAGYEGDLMAMAGVPYATGREARETYGESVAGRQQPVKVYPVDPFRIAGDSTSGLLPGVVAEDHLALGAADDAVPACNFRLQLSKDPADRAPFPEFGAYDPAQYELLSRWFAVHRDAPKKLPFAIYNGSEFNDNRDELMSLALVGGSKAYLDGDWATRARVWREHERYTVGLFRFLATDPRIPESLRTEAAQWGLRRSAFPKTDGWPHQLYLRQGRRLLGAQVITQNDLEGRVSVVDVIGLGSYKVDIYHARRYATTGGVAIEGKVFTTLGKPGERKAQDNNGSQPYAIPYRALTPCVGSIDNLLVPVCLSASNVAMSSIRMEPVWMLIGEAAGRAASQTVAQDCAVQALDVPRLQQRLRESGQVLELP